MHSWAQVLPQSAIANPSVFARFLRHPLVKVINAFLLKCMCVLDLLLAAAVLLFGYFLAAANVLFIRYGLSARQQIRGNSSFDHGGGGHLAAADDDKANHWSNRTLPFPNN